MVDILLKKDVKEIYEASREGITPIHEAFQNNNAILAEKLLWSIPKEDVFEALDKRTNAGLSPIHVVCYEGNCDVLKCVIQAVENGSVRVELMNAKDKTENIPLHLACKAGKIGIIVDLIANKSDIVAKNVYGHTPLHVAARYGHTEIVEILIEKMFSVDLTDKFKQTPLHRAAKYNQVETIVLLTKRYIIFFLYHIALLQTDGMKNILNAL